MSHNIIEATDQTFATLVEKHKGYALVDFWAPWCGPCRQLAPVLEKIADHFDPKVLKVIKMNVDDNVDIPTQMGVRGIPALFLFRNGEKVDNKVGTMTYAAIENWLSGIVLA